MLSLAMVSFSPCSAAISSSTGATILHGPHHSAQKSTSTGLALPSTSLAKLASVTVLVLPAMSLSLLMLPLEGGLEKLAECPVRTTAGVGWLCPGSALAEGRGQPAF